MSENANISKAAGVVGAATLISRILGFIRDAVIAWFLGAGLSSDAFFVAFRIPNLFRRLFAEGALSIAFIPVFTEYLTHHGKDEAFDLARSFMRFLFIVLLVSVIAGILMSPMIIRILAPGFSEIPIKFSLTVMLTRIMFFYILLICLAAVCMGILNVMGHFFAPAIAPAFLNLAMIGSVFVLSHHTTPPVKGLAIGVLIGGVLQLSFQIPFLIKKGLFFWQNASIFHPGLRKAGAGMLPAIFSTAVYQINILVGTLLASMLSEGSLSYLYYADRIVEFPLGIFAVSGAIAVLPSLSKQSSMGDFDAFRETFAYAIKMIAFITLPAMTGLIVLREPIVALLFKRGAFNIETTRLTASALLYYCIGLWAFSSERIIISTCYALQDTKTPIKTAILSLLTNIVLGILLMSPMGHNGLALSTSAASMLNCGLLLYALKTKMGILKGKSIMESAIKSLFCSVMMGAGVFGISQWIIPHNYESPSGLFRGLMISIAAGIALYMFLSYILKSHEFRSALGALKCSKVP